MKTFGKIIICILVVLAAMGIAYSIYNGKAKETNTTTNIQNTGNNVIENKTDENTDYIGEEENKEEPIENNEQEATEPEKENQTEELRGKDKAIDIVKKKYAIDDQTVRFDHMEGPDYVIKINDGTAVTWYLVNGTTWEAEEY